MHLGMLTFGPVKVRVKRTVRVEMKARVRGIVGGNESESKKEKESGNESESESEDDREEDVHIACISARK